MSYCSIALFKSAVFPEGTEDTVDDDRIQLALDAATAAIDSLTGRTFVPETDTTRIFRAVYYDHLDVVDLMALTSLKIDTVGDGSFATTLYAKDYVLEPFTGPPYSVIRSTPLADYTFWVGQLVQAVGDWNLSTPPATVQQACLLLANRLWKRQDAPFGVLELPTLGEVARIGREDPDVPMLLGSYMRGGAASWIAV